METDLNKLSYTLRYRTDEGKKVFKNYKIEGTTIVKADIIDKDNIINATVTIPSIQDNDTLEFISSTIYYLKIYKFSENDLLINNTISIVDGIETYKTYEFKINESQVNKNIEIPQDDNKYYISISAITSDKELLNYKSFYIDVKKDEDDNKIWIIILIILLVLILIILLAIIIHCLLKKRKNQIEDINKMEIMQLNNDKSLEEKINS